jgi:hypothetical protein
LKWKQKSRYHAESDCGMYRITKYFTDPNKYLSWEKVNGAWNTVGEVSMTLKEAERRFK